jgi:iron complex outermembrane recepter protein
MGGRCMRLPRALIFWTLPAMVLGPSEWAAAQQESAVSAEAQPGDPSTRATGEAGGRASDILNLDIDQLAKTPVVGPAMDIPVTSVTRETSTVGRSPAAVFVITNEMIRRGGATSIAGSRWEVTEVPRGVYGTLTWQR